MKNINKKSVFLTTITTLTLILSVNAQAKIYKWTDANGQTHYSAQPPAQNTKGTKAKNIEDEIKAFAGKYRPPTKEKTSASANQDEENQSNDSNPDEQLAGPNKQLVKYCDNQRNNLKQLRKNFRNVWIDVKGKKTNLNQEQRKEKVATLVSEISKNCAGVDSAKKESNNS